MTSWWLQAFATTPIMDLEPAGYLRYDPGRKWRDSPPCRALRPWHGLRAGGRAALRSDQGGLSVDGGRCLDRRWMGFRCVAILEALEQDLGRPVISANQASLWRSLSIGWCSPPRSPITETRSAW